MKRPIRPVSQPRQKPVRPKAGNAMQMQAMLLREEAQRNKNKQWIGFGFAGLLVAGGWAYVATMPDTPQKATAVAVKEAPKQVEEAGPDKQTTLESLQEELANNPQPATPVATPNQTPALQPDTVAKRDTTTEPAEDKLARQEADRLSKEEPLVLVGQDSTREMHTSRDLALLKSSVDNHSWDAYRGFLAKSIEAGLAKLSLPEGRNRFDGVWKEAPLYQTILRWKVLGRFSEPELVEVAQDAYTGEMLLWMLTNNGPMEQLIDTIKPQDDGAKVLRFPRDAWEQKGAEPKKYFNLAIACAVIFDRDIKITTPDKNYEDETKVDPIRRYLWYVEKNEKGKLATSIDRMDARDLTWVVCAPVSTSEMDWAISKMSLHRKNWGNAYGMVEYLMERAVTGLNPYDEYTFAEILKKGGICGDQSYFCTNTARANGIPAMTLAGETDLGGHAWVGMKIKDDEWTTGIGRIGGVSKGEAGEPQTGGSITEQEIQLWGDRAHQSDVTRLSVFRHLLIADYYQSRNNEAQLEEAVRLANVIGPSFTETWARLYRVLESMTDRKGDPAAPDVLSAWKDFASRMRREFKDNPRMAELAAKAEVDHIFPYGEENDAKRALMRERRRIERNSGEQADLIADSLKRQAELIAKRNDANSKRDIARIYETGMREYGGSVTGFKMMAEDYFSYFKDDQEQGKKVVRDIELAYKRVIETGTKDWFRAKTEVGIYRTICGYYRTVGESARAEMLEKRLDRLMEQAERGAL